jgi:alpha-tubulin suppressor-like RCC1 family protein
MKRVAAAVVLLLVVSGLTTRAAASVSSWSISAQLERSTVTIGEPVRLTGQVYPSARGDDVILQRKVAGKWITWDHAKLNAHSRFTFVLHSDVPTRYDLRVVKPAEVRRSIRYVRTVSNSSTAYVTTWTEIAVSEHGACGLRSTRTLWCWGLQFEHTDRWPKPMDDGLRGNWAQLELGAHHGCAIKITGALHCWGDDARGQLGTGESAGYSLGNSVASDGTWIDVAAGEQHTCGIKSDHTLWCWGGNYAGQLGLGSSDWSDRKSPTQSGGDSDWTSVTAAGDYNCATKSAGTLYCWGSGSPTPTLVASDVDLGVVEGAEHWCGLDLDGHFACRTIRYGESVIEVHNSDITFAELAVDGRYRCGIDVGHRLFCWWRPEVTGPASPDDPPFEVPVRVGSGEDWLTVDVGPGNACAIRRDGYRYCWGRNGYTQHGDGSITSSFVPLQARTHRSFTDLAVGELHACAIDEDDRLFCWGDNAGGGLGDGTTTDRSRPTPIQPAHRWRSIARTDQAACAVRMDRTLWCFTSPGEWMRVDEQADWKAVFGGLRYGDKTLCALRLDGSLWCGSGGAVTQVGSASNWATYDGGWNHQCAVTTGGELYCWGDNFQGELGLGKQGGYYADPTRVGTETDWRQVSAGLDYTCAVNARRELYCWGAPRNGRLGHGELNAFAPVRAFGGLDWARVAAGFEHTCGLTTEGSAWCWGSDDRGQLGAEIDWPVLKRRVGRAPWSAIGVGRDYTCGLRVTGALLCWGEGRSGQLAVGATLFRALPTRFY